jgi:hypothetical protein
MSQPIILPSPRHNLVMLCMLPSARILAQILPNQRTPGRRHKIPQA